MTPDTIPHFFYQLVLRQYLGFVSTAMISHCADSDALWIQTKDSALLPFWKLVDMGNDHTAPSLLKRLPQFFKPFKPSSSRFIETTDHWVSVLDRLFDERWFKASPPPVRAIRQVLHFQLTSLCAPSLKQLHALIKHSDLPQKDEGLAVMATVEQQCNCEHIDKLATWILGVLEQASHRLPSQRRFCTELADIFIPLYMTAVYFKVFAFYILKTQSRPTDSATANRIEELLNLAIMESNVEGGLSKALQDSYWLLAQPEGLPLEGYLDSQHTFSKQIGLCFLTHVHALHLYALTHKEPRLNSVLEFYKDTITPSAYTDAVGPYLEEVCQRLRMVIDEQHLLLQTIPEHELQVFKQTCLKTEAFLRWFSGCFFHFIHTEAIADASKILLAIVPSHPDGVLWLQWALHLLPSVQKEGVCQHLVRHCPLEQFTNLRHVIGLACLPISKEECVKLEAFFPSDSRDLFMRGNTVEFVNDWATQTRHDLLQLPASFWERLYQPVLIQDITQSAFIAFLVDAYESKGAEAALLDVLMRLCDDLHHKKLDKSGHAYLALLAFAVFFKKRRVQPDLLLPYFSCIEDFKQSIHDIVTLLDTPPLDSTSYPRWLGFVLEKLNKELTGILLTQPPELVLYTLSDPGLLKTVCDRIAQGILQQIEDASPLFSKLAIFAALEPLFFKTCVEHMSTYLKGESKERFLNFISHRQVVGNGFEKAFAKAMGHFALHQTHNKGLSTLKRGMDLASSPLFSLTSYVNVFLSELPFGSTQQPELRSFLLQITPALCLYVSSTHAEPIQRVFKALHSPETLEPALTHFWVTCLTDDRLKRPSMEDTLCHMYGFLAQFLIPESERVLRIPLTIFTPALYMDRRLVSPENLPTYLTMLRPFLNRRDMPVLTLSVIASLIPDPACAKHSDNPDLVESIVQIMTLVQQNLQLSHEMDIAWFHAEQTAVTRVLQVAYAFLLHSLHHIALPLISFTSVLITKGKLVDKPAALNYVSTQSLQIESEAALHAFELCLTQFKTLETLFDVLQSPPSFKGKSFSKLTSVLLTCFETMPDVLYALQTQRPQAYLQLVLVLSQLEVHLIQKDPDSKLLAFIQLHLPHLWPEIAKHERHALCDLVHDYLNASGQEVLLSAVSNRFFGESSASVQAGFVVLHAYQFQHFRHFIYHRATTLQGLKVEVFAQKLKYTVLLHIFTQLLSHPPTFPVAVHSELLVSLHRLIQDLGNQHKHDFESIYRASESMYRLIVKGEPFTADLLYIRQLILSHQHEFLASGLFAQDAFTRFSQSHAPSTLLVQLFFIVMTLYIARLDAPKETVLHSDEIATVLGRALVHFFVFSKDPTLLYETSQVMAYVDMLEKHGRSVIAPAFQEKPLSRYNLESLYHLLESDSNATPLKRFSHWLSRAHLFEGLSVYDACMSIELLSSLYQVPFSVLKSGFSSHEQLEACTTYFKDTNRYIADHLASDLELSDPTMPAVSLDPKLPIQSDSVERSLQALLQWALRYEKSQDRLSFYRLFETFSYLFRDNRALASRLIPAFHAQYASLFWELIFDRSKQLLPAFMAYLLHSSTHDYPLPDGTLYAVLKHSRFRQNLLDHLFQDSTALETYPISELPYAVQCLVVEQDVHRLTHLTDPLRFCDLIAHLVSIRRTDLLAPHIAEHPNPFFAAIFTGIFPNQPKTHLTAEQAFEILELMTEEQVFDCVQAILQQAGSDLSFVCEVLFQHPYFSVSYHQRSHLLSRVIDAFCRFNKDRFSRVLQDLSFAPEATPARYLSYAFLLTQTEFLSLHDLAFYVGELGFVPAGLSSLYHQMFQDAFKSPAGMDVMMGLSQRSAQGFRAVLGLPDMCVAIRLSITAQTLRPLTPLTRVICRTILSLLPIDVFHMITRYVCHDLEKKTATLVRDRLRQFYKLMQKPTGFKQVSEGDTASLKSDILAIVNSPYPHLDSEDPIFHACLSALRYSDYASHSIQRVLDCLNVQTSTTQQLYVDSYMATVGLHLDSRWVFLCYIDQEIRDPFSPLFTRLIEGWETQASIWNRYIHASLSQKETIFSQQFLRRLCQQFLHRSPSTSQNVTELYAMFGFFYTHCPSQKPALLSWLNTVLVKESSPSELSLFDQILDSTLLSDRDILSLITSLLTHRKGVLARPVLDRVMPSRFVDAVWVACDAPSLNLAGYIESWIFEALEQPEGNDTPLIPLCVQAIRNQKMVFLDSMARAIARYHDTHAQYPSWLFQLVLDNDEVFLERVMTHCPKFHVAFMQSTDRQDLLDTCILFSHRMGYDIPLPFESIFTLLLQEPRHYLSRQALIDALFSSSLNSADNHQLASLLLKKMVPMLETPVLETRQALQECIIGFFVRDAGLFHNVLHAHTALIYGHLNLSVPRLYEARTRLLVLLKSKLDVTSLLHSDRTPIGINALELFVAALSLQQDHPNLFATLCEALCAQYGHDDALFHALLGFVKPGLHVGRVPHYVFDELPNGSELRYFLQHYHLMDAFGLLLIQDVHPLPATLHAREAYIAILKLTKTLTTLHLSDDSLLQKDAEKQWKTIAKLLSAHSDTFPFEWDTTRLLCKILEEHGYLKNTYKSHFLILQDLLTDMMSMNISQLTRPDYSPYVLTLFSKDLPRLDRFIAQLPVTLTRDDLLKKKMIPEKTSMVLSKLESEGYCDSQGQITAAFYSSTFRLSGVDPKETRFWRDFLVSHVQTKRRAVSECLATMQYIECILHGNDHDALETTFRLFSVIPRQKWLLIVALLNHPKAVFSRQHALIHRLKTLPFQGWDSQFTPESLQRTAKELTQHKVPLEEAVTTLFEGFKLAIQPSGVNRAHLSRLISDLSQLMKTSKKT